MKKSLLVVASLLLLSACQSTPFGSGYTGRTESAPASTLPPFVQPLPPVIEPPSPLPPVPVDQNGVPTACTMEYRPVCGKVAIVCITTPCNPIDQTFGNACMAKASNAYDIREGECK